MKSYVWITFAFLGWGYYEASGGADFKPGTSNVQTASAVAAEVAPSTDTVTVQTADADSSLQHKLEAQLLATLRKERSVARMPQVSDIQTVAFRAADHAELTARPAAFISTKGTSDEEAEIPETVTATAEELEPTETAPTATPRPRLRPANLEVVRSAGFEAPFVEETPVVQIDIPTAAAGWTRVEDGRWTRQPVAETARADTGLIPRISTSGVSFDPAFRNGRVATSRANLRLGPGTNYPVLMKLRGGSDVRILREGQDGWVKVKALDDGRIGWMVDYLLTAS